jgi:hypothetical protein
VPPACSKPFEQAVLCRRLVEVEGLGIELGGERLYRRGIDRPRRGGEFLAGAKSSKNCRLTTSNARWWSEA